MKMNKRKTKWNLNKHKVSHMSVLYHRKPPPVAASSF